MSSPRTGIWFIGARGGVASTATLGLLALQKGVAQPTGLVSQLPQFQELDLADWGSFVVGGHEIREGMLIESLERLRADSRVMDAATIDACRTELSAADGRIVPGTLANVGATITGLSGLAMRDFADEPPRQTIRRLQDDLRRFQKQAEVERVIVVNVASTEPSAADLPLPHRWNDLEAVIDSSSPPALPASSLYAIAAFDLGLAYVNFTPSLGATPAAIQELAKLRGACHAGQDGKTGETLLKSVLAPMFAARNLEVMSWVGHNIFGNLDGQVLDDPANKAAKIKSKDKLVGDILGYDPQTLVSIDATVHLARL
jgi:myo-inositol-1-phosphate synthase